MLRKQTEKSFNCMSVKIRWSCKSINLCSWFNPLCPLAAKQTQSAIFHIIFFILSDKDIWQSHIPKLNIRFNVLKVEDPNRTPPYIFASSMKKQLNICLIGPLNLSQEGSLLVYVGWCNFQSRLLGASVLLGSFTGTFLCDKSNWLKLWHTWVFK